MARAGLGNTKIDYINAHGTSTPVGDIIEIEAMREVFGEEMPRVSSTKSLTGHAQGAAGVHEAIYSLLMLEHDFLAASANIEELDPEAEGVPLVRAREDDAGLDCVMSNSFGFGGTNASLAFKRFEPWGGRWRSGSPCGRPGRPRPARPACPRPPWRENAA